jgi:thymidine phosphorylase
MARKSKGFGELLSQQREEKIHREGLAKLQDKVQQGALGDKFAGMVENPKGEVKMSEVLESFVEPYLDAARNHSQREKLFGIAMVAWNLALMPEGDRPSLIDRMVKAGIQSNDRLAQQDTREIINEMIVRKQKFFADNKRCIVDFQLQDVGNQFHLSVASTLLNPPVVG